MVGLAAVPVLDDVFFKRLRPQTGFRRGFRSGFFTTEGVAEFRAFDFFVGNFGSIFFAMLGFAAFRAELCFLFDGALWGDVFFGDFRGDLVDVFTGDVFVGEFLVGDFCAKFQAADFFVGDFFVGDFWFGFVTMHGGCGEFRADLCLLLDGALWGDVFVEITAEIPKEDIKGDVVVGDFFVGNFLVGDFLVGKFRAGFRAADFFLGTF